MTRPNFELGWYNGWSPDERRATLPLQREAIARGLLAKPRTCSICSVTWTSENPVWLHDENYAEPLRAYAVCRRCHGILHRRFEAPQEWTDLVQQHASGGRWFELLSMEPASKTKPFCQTYPQGLPSA